MAVPAHTHACGQAAGPVRLAGFDHGPSVRPQTGPQRDHGQTAADWTACSLASKVGRRGSGGLHTVATGGLHALNPKP